MSIQQNEKSEKATLTVVMPYIDAGAVSAALASVEAQTAGLDRLQILLIADGCEPLYTEYDSIAIPYNTLQGGGTTPGGRPRAVGSLVAKGDWVTYLDQDCWWAPNHLERLFAIVDEIDNSKAVIFTQREMHRPGATYHAPSRYVPDTFDSVGLTDKGMFIDTNCLTIRREKAAQIFGLWAFPVAYADDKVVCAGLVTAGFEFFENPVFSVHYPLSQVYFNNLKKTFGE